VLIVDDEVPFRQLIERRLRRQGAEVTGAGSGEEALLHLQERDFDLAILDINMPGISGIELLGRLKAQSPETEAIVITGQASVASAIEAMRQGAYDYVEKPLKMQELTLLVEKALERRRLAVENVRLKTELARLEPCREIVGESAALREALSHLQSYATEDAAVLILGESGTGKELAARAIHRLGTRPDGPFVPINCGALQETILENELFGHRKGAFTGADRDRAGLFETADGGVLFIDEVCEMGLNVQRAFLRVLEDQKVRRLGDVREREVSVRVVAATNRDIEQEVREGRFREDLYYRLNVLRVELPPLRDRPEDLPLLVEHYLALRARRDGRHAEVTQGAIARLAQHRWPGNVRELFNVLERALIISPNGVVRASDLPDFSREHRGLGRRGAGAGAGAGAEADPASSPTLEDVERRHIARVLEACGHVKTKAARRLGISVRSLYRKIDKHGLRPPDVPTPDDQT